MDITKAVKHWQMDPRTNQGRVSVQGVKSLWGDCRFIPADWGS